jgi:hypothetical protein
MTKPRRTGLSNEKARLKYFLWYTIQRYQPYCYFCEQLFVYEDILPKRGVDNLTEHHRDGDHMNMNLGNRILVHRYCHKAHHTKDNINKEE